MKTYQMQTKHIWLTVDGLNHISCWHWAAQLISFQVLISRWFLIEPLV